MISNIKMAPYIVASSLFLVGCSSKPSDADILAATVESYKHLPGVSVVSITRDNGEKISETKYDVYARATLKFQMSSSQIERILNEKEKTTTDVFEKVYISTSKMKLPHLKNICPQIEKGPSECIVKVNFGFRKTEKGWEN